MAKPDRNPVIEAMCEKYWNAYQAGITAAGVRGYPKWHESTDPVKDETRRCMRHAVEALRANPAWGAALKENYRPPLKNAEIVDRMFGALFPDKPQRRRLKPIPNDQMQAVSQKIARMGE